MNANNAALAVDVALTAMQGVIIAVFLLVWPLSSSAGMGPKIERGMNGYQFSSVTQSVCEALATKNGPAIEKALASARKTADTATTIQLISFLQKPDNNLTAAWTSVSGVSTGHVAALSREWIVRRPVDYLTTSAMFATDPDGYIGYKTRSLYFRSLVARDYLAAVAVIAERSRGSPTLLDAIYCSQLLREKSATEAMRRESARLLITASNSVILATAFHLLPPTMPDSALEDPLRRALESTWMSLHKVFLEHINAVSPETARRLLQEFIARSAGESLKAEALAALNELD